MMSQARQQIITIHILPNISKGDDSQALKLGHLVKYSVKNTFSRAAFKKWDRVTSSRTLCAF